MSENQEQGELDDNALELATGGFANKNDLSAKSNHVGTATIT